LKIWEKNLNVEKIAFCVCDYAASNYKNMFTVGNVLNILMNMIFTWYPNDFWHTFLPIQCIVGYCHKCTCACDCFCGPGWHTHTHTHTHT